MECPNIKNIGPSTSGCIPCELCSIINELGKLVSETGKQVRQLEPVIAYERMKKEYLKLSNSHAHCAGCGLMFGGQHIAVNGAQKK
jgi:hypothetical protein